MSKIVFTDQFVKSVKPGDKLITYSAINCQSLHLRVTPNGVKTFTMVYRSSITGEPKGVTLGRYPDVEVSTAIEWVNDARKRNALSQPVGEFTVAKKNEPSVADMLALYKTNRLSRKRSGDEMHSALTSFVTANKWNALPFTSLTKKQVMAALEAMAVETAPYATRMQRLMSTWFKWGVINDHCAANPIAGMPPVGGPPVIRERALSFAEIRKLWVACHNPEAYGLRQVYADVLLTILTTACRPGMACGLIEDELFGIDGRPAAWKRGAGAVLDFPKERMKMNRPFVLPVNWLTLEVIERRRAIAVDGVLFPTASVELKDRGQTVSVRHLARVTRMLSKRLGFKEPFTPHDLRRTASDLLCREFDVNVEVNALLAHETTHGVMKHYNPQNRWNGLDIKRKLIDRLAEMLIEIVGKSVTSGEVVEIRRVA